jgi:hypothetical protein
MSTDWAAWHDRYDDPLASLGARLAVVQSFIRDFLDSRSERDSRVISLCAGEGLDLLGVLATHPMKPAVTARLIELDPQLAAEARGAARAEGLTVSRSSSPTQD